MCAQPTMPAVEPPELTPEARAWIEQDARTERLLDAMGGT